MFLLHMNPTEFGMAYAVTVKAPYAKKADAEAQADHNLENKTQTPLYITDEAGVIVRDYRPETPAQ